MPKEKLLDGENDSYICKLIRDDSIEKFIILVNHGNISLSNSKIDYSICETNAFLMQNEPTLIEYAAFFGSIQIFQYLILNGVELTPSLWLYAIHGRNSEMIYILEENNVEPPGNTYQECIKESIKCHHNEIADYLMNNFYCLEKKEECCKLDEIQFASIKNYNFEYFPRYISFDSYDIFIYFNEYCPFLFQIICNEKNMPHGMLIKIRRFIDNISDKEIMKYIKHFYYHIYDNDPFLNCIWEIGFDHNRI